MYSDALPGYSELQIQKTQNCEEQQIREIVFHKYSLKILQPYKCLLSKNKQFIFFVNFLARNYFVIMNKVWQTFQRRCLSGNINTTYRQYLCRW